MVLDSSAILAVLLEEPGFEELEDRINRAAGVRIGAPTLLEVHIVLTRKSSSQARLRAFLDAIGATTVAFTSEHLNVAIDAHGRFGRGRHPAKLNFGDCFSYAIARLAREPLLYTGDDFAKTDIEAA
ncbi:MAG TPA: type II toxin-antitoxin system VapC family toxin [Bryobacteraceae bacterium]|nr:type II toxin-antitoxin system VapC family toxin [Bryobacteraceae bacterium]